MEPFTIPASRYCESAYCFNNPFVEVLSEAIGELEELDMVRRLKVEPMDPKALARVVQEALFEPMEIKAVSPEAFLEAGFHLSLLKGLVKYADEGLYLHEISDPEEEEAVLDDDELPLEQHAGTKNKRIEVLAQDNLIAEVKCVKPSGDFTDAVFQAGYYAKEKALENMSRGRFSPIYLFGFGKSYWKYGILKPYGIVTVKDGRVCSIESQSDLDTQGTMEAMLHKATFELRQKYHGLQSYPDGDYLSGLLFCDTEDYTLPDEGGRPWHMALFYQSWLEVISGPAVCRWSVEDVEARLKAWNAQLHRKCAKVTDRMLSINEL